MKRVLYLMEFQWKAFTQESEIFRVKNMEKVEKFTETVLLHKGIGKKEN